MFIDVYLDVNQTFAFSLENIRCNTQDQELVELTIDILNILNTSHTVFSCLSSMSIFLIFCMYNESYCLMNDTNLRVSPY